jgi:hypothetical protein
VWLRMLSACGSASLARSKKWMYEAVNGPAR